MAQQEVNLEQTDFSAGLITDANPLEFPPNATLDERNFQIEKDGSRRRRLGLELETDDVGTLITPDADFYSEPSVTSKTYSTIAPNPSKETTYTSVKKDVVTLTDTRTTAGAIKSFDAEDDSLSEIPHSLNYSSYEGPFLATQHINYQAFVCVDSASTNFLASLIYGYNNAGNELGVLTPSAINYDSNSGVAQITGSDARIADISSWSGRMVYAFNSNNGIRGFGIGISRLPDPALSASSQLSDLSECTAVTPASPISTDGAWIYAGDLGIIRRVITFRTGLLIFTDESIWFLSAPNGYFDPYNFGFDKISNTRVASDESIVSVDKTILFWSEAGIYIIYPDENSGLPIQQNITANRIQKFYDGLAPSALQNSRGVYNKERNEVRWLYSNDPEDFDISTRQRFQAELIFSLSDGAWTVNFFVDDDTTYVIDYIPDRAAEEDTAEAGIVDSSGNKVTNVAGQQLLVQYLIGFNLTSNFKYVIRDGASQARLAIMSDESFYDFVNSQGFPTGVDSPAYMKSGWFTFSGTQRRKTPNWLTVTLEATESGYDINNDVLLTPSSCKVTTYWDYANDDYSAKKHGPYEAYRLNRLYMPQSTEWKYGQDFISTKNKIRGRGRTVQFLFETSEGKDCRLYSWGFNGTILTRV